MSTARALGRLAAATLGLGAACVTWGVTVSAVGFRLRRVSAPVLPEDAAPVRVLHLSDIHLTPRTRARADFVRSLASLRPDLVVNTGDNLSTADAVAPLVDALGGLLDVPGGLVFGSNDFTGPVLKNPLSYLGAPTPVIEPPLLPSDELRERLTAGGWRWLEGERVVLDVAGSRIELRGTGDAHIDRDRWADVAGPRGADVDVVLGVTHAPYLRVVEAAAADDVDLLLAGHTHGGQVCVPTPWGPTEGRALTTNCDLPARQVKGLSEVPRPAGREAMLLHVSAGLGMSPFAPYRFACPPEVTLLTLVPRP